MMPRYEWVSVHEASRRLGRSVSTIRRQIESGELVGEREPLAKGSNRDRYRVRLDAPETPQETPQETPASETPIAPPDASEAPQDAPAAMTRLLDVVLSQAERIAALEREAGTLQGRVEAQQASIEQYIIDMLEQTERGVRAETEADRLRARRWWKFW